MVVLNSRDRQGIYTVLLVIFVEFKFLMISCALLYPQKITELLIGQLLWSGRLRIFLRFNQLQL